MWIDKVIFVTLLIPMLLLGTVLAGLFVPGGAVWQVLFIGVWLVANTHLMIRYCWSTDGILLLRLISFALLHAGALCVLLLYFG